MGIGTLQGFFLNKHYVVLCFFIGIFWSNFLLAQVLPQDQSERQLIREQEREKARQKQQEKNVDVRLEIPPLTVKETRIPDNESPCFMINHIKLVGERSADFQWLLRSVTATPSEITSPLVFINNKKDASSLGVLGRCLGVTGIGVVMRQMQNQLVARGYVTSRVVAGAQDLTSGTLALTLVPGKIHEIRFSDNASHRNVLPMSTGDLLNLRDIEQALESMKRLPSVDADINIEPAKKESQTSGESNLIIDWQQTSPVRIVATADNFGGENTGTYQGGLSLAYDNLFGLHDIINVSLNHDIGGGNPLEGGTESYSLSYTVPYHLWDVSLNFNKNTFFQTVQGAFEKNQFSGESHNAGLFFSRLLHRDSVRKVNIEWGGWFRSSKNFTNDSENSDQRRRTSGYEVTLDYREFIRSSILNASVTYRRGTGAFDAIDAPEAFFNEGVSRPSIMKTNVQLSTPFSIGKSHFTYSGEWRRQLNRDRLITQDRFSI